MWAIGLAVASISVLSGTIPAEAAAQTPPSPFVLSCPGVGTCPSLVDSGGAVQTKPRIYLMFWGSQWNTAPYSGYVNKVTKFFQLLPGSDWQQSLHAYSGKNGQIKGLTYGGAVLDSSDPPVLTQPADDQLDPEILAAAASQNWTMNSETQVIVYTEPGKSNVSYCGVHGAIKNGGGALFAWIPYTTDPGRNCQAVYPFGSTSKIPIVGDLIWPATHELAENATASAWTISPADNGSEIGDPCNGVIAPFDREPGAGVYVQYLLDRVSGKCADYQAIQPTPNTASLSALDGGVSCTAADACMAVGHSYAAPAPAEVTLAEAWNGSAWSVVPTPDPAASQGSFFSGVSCTAASACTAVGNYINAAGATVPLAEAWNGSAWSIQSTPDPGGSTFSELHAVSCTAANACTAVGSYLNSAGHYASLAEAWNGTQWSVQATPDPTGSTGSSLSGVSCTGASACTAVGGFTNGSAPEGTTLAEAWNGTTWSIQSMPTFTGSTLFSVSCASSMTCTGVGNYFNRTTGAEGTLVASWNGKIWFFSPTVLTNADLYGVSCTARYACTAVGQMQDSSGTTVTLVENPFRETYGDAIQPTPNPTGSTATALNGVSCTAAHTCTAVGSSETSSATLTLAEAE
jgi:hypothetical protein